MIHIGTIIKDYCRVHKIPLQTLASQINITTPSLYSKIRRNDMALSTLDAISKATDHNFFLYFIPGSGTTAEHLVKLSTNNKELSAKVASLQKENALQQEIIALLKANSQ